MLRKRKMGAKTPEEPDWSIRCLSTLTTPTQKLTKCWDEQPSGLPRQNRDLSSHQMMVFAVYAPRVKSCFYCAYWWWVRNEQGVNAKSLMSPPGLPQPDGTTVAQNEAGENPEHAVLCN